MKLLGNRNGSFSDAIRKKLARRRQESAQVDKFNYEQMSLDDISEENAYNQTTNLNLQIRPNNDHSPIQINIPAPIQAAKPIPVDWQTSLGPKKSVLRTKDQNNSNFPKQKNTSRRHTLIQDESCGKSSAPINPSWSVSLGGRSGTVRRVVASSTTLKRAASRHM